MRIRALAMLASVIFLAWPTLAQQSPAERARAEQAAGNLATAGMHWRQVLETHPDNVEALGGRLLGRGRHRQKNHHGRQGQSTDAHGGPPHALGS